MKKEIKEETTKMYDRNARDLSDRYKIDTGHSWREDPLAFVGWCGAHRPRWMPSTWRLYRASIVWFMHRHGLIEAVELAQQISSAPCRKAGRRRGRLPSQELEATVKKLARHGDEYDLLAICLIHATQATGLRPFSEWHGAKLTKYPERWELLVQNAKHDETRGNGETRRLQLLLEMPQAELRTIDYVVEKVNALSHEEWVRDYRRARDRLRRARPRGSKIRFYDARHQFVANCKAQGLTRAQVAALLGHASDATAARHYGRKVHGNRRVYVNVLAEEVATVRSRASDYPFDATLSHSPD